LVKKSELNKKEIYKILMPKLETDFKCGITCVAVERFTILR
jgi:hypothetical protein